MTRPLIIIGAGGGAYDVLDVVEAINGERPTWEIAGFLDDAASAGAIHLSWPVLGTVREAPRFTEAAFVNVIGSDKSYTRRPAIIQATGLDLGRFATLVHPGAAVSSRARLGCGVCVHAGASVAGNVTL